MTLALLFIPFLEDYVWHPFWTIIVFVVVVLWDFVSAVAVNIKSSKFVTSKAIKLPFTLAAYVLLFAILHSLSKVIEAFEMDTILNPVAFQFLAKSVYFLCFAINLLSALKHMSLLGLLPAQVSKFIEKFIDVHKNKLETTITDNTINTDDNDNVPR
jgi:hypothetical protein